MLRTAVSLVLLACALLGFAQEHKGVLYKLPAGWQESVEGDAKIFVPKDLKEGQIVMIVLTPAVGVTNDPAKKQFEQVVATANQGVKVIAAGDVSVREAGGISVCAQAFQLDAKDLGRHSRIYTMIVSAQQRALAMILIKQDELADKYGDAIAEFIGSLKLKSASEAKSPEAPKSDSGTPYGDTPDFYPGMPQWRPSGKGLPIPASDLVNGKPQGIWWTMSYGSGDRAMTFVFLPNGQQASNPRYGGGNLWDIEGQKRAPGANGVGPFSVANGKITRDYDGFHHEDPYATGADSSGKFFKIGKAIYRPLAPVSKKSIVGTWRFPGRKYIFNADGTYEFGQVAQGDGWAAGSHDVGTYSIDGRLVVLRRSDGLITVQPMGMAGTILIVNGILHKKD